MRFDPDFHQPFNDENVVGYQRQSPMEMSLDVSMTPKPIGTSMHRRRSTGSGQMSPFQPFIGFGRVDPNSGQIFRLTNMSWSSAKYRGVIITVAKNMSRGSALFGSPQDPREVMSLCL
jgi:hypothetical protein